MFRTFAKVSGIGAQGLFQFHPADLIALLELAWDHRAEGVGLPLGHPLHRSDLTRFEDSWFGRRALQPPAPPPPPTRPLQPNLNLLINAIGGPPDFPPRHHVLWDHLVYAYMVENTRIVEIFRRVVHELTHGEKLGAPSVATLHWLRNTEEMFYRDGPSYFAPSLHSSARPDCEAMRRTTYHRMLGMDLNHGTADNKPYPFTRAEAANKEFVSTFEELLREVWIGIVNAGNSSGIKSTDDAKLAELTQTLQEMLLARRLQGQPVARGICLRVDDVVVPHDGRDRHPGRHRPACPGDQRRAAALQDRAARRRSGARPRRQLLRHRGLDLEGAAPGRDRHLHPGSQGGDRLLHPRVAARDGMRTIITHWSVITGRDMKAGKIAPADAPRRPVLAMPAAERVS